MDQALLSTHIHFYSSASYTFQEENGDYQKIEIHVGDVVEIALMEGECGFAIVKAIFKHHGNDEQDYVFVYIVWFEDISRRDKLTLCPIYHLQRETNDSWYHVHREIYI